MAKGKLTLFFPSKMVRSKAGVANVMQLVVGVILVVAVAIPVTSDMVNNSTATGTTRTILNLLVLFLAIGLLVMIARGSGVMD